MQQQLDRSIYGILRLMSCLSLILGFWLSSTAFGSTALGLAESNSNLSQTNWVQSRQTQETVTKFPQNQADRNRSQMPPDMQRIRQRGKLIVAMLNQENSPFFMTDSARHFTGLDVKLAQALADQLGVRLEFNRTATTFDEVVKTVYALNADLAISKLSRTLNRAERVRFSQPYLTMRQGLLVNRLQIAQQANGRSMTDVIRNLQGKIGVIRGSSYVGFTQKKFPNTTVVEFPSWTEAVEAVIRGEILATYRDELEVKKIVLSQPHTALTLQTIALTDTQDTIAIALPWDSQQLLAYVNQYLDMSAVDYTVESLLQEYPMATASPTPLH
jgi:polar amino acid transport system substrate-binding protein